ncbi:MULTISPECIES: helix-turn-helix transcriptional regulator [unclassified Streptomyces]|uniref:helix-turn-helix domain-containing protein n=1 Tax=Streptomyces sp. SID4917 TaxID=2690269 RepID=UPI001F3A05C7|nr:MULTISPECIES: helix-turn-helix transcriptional regulator [unclassified Streptomyces]
MLEEAEEIGRRARRARLRLGMTQADLAAALGKTQGWVSKMERGHIELDRVGLLNLLASELHVHPNDLIGRPYNSSPAENQWQVAAASIMRELRRYDLTPVFDGTPRSARQLWQETTRLHRLRDAAANVAIMEVLPDLFRETRALAESATGHEREEAYAIYAVCCKFAHTSAHALGHPELVAMACERAAWSARQSGDPVLPAVADWMRVWDMWATADWDDAIALSDKAIRSVQEGYDLGEPLAVRAWGSLQLRAAISAARGGHRAEARERVDHARTAADRMTPWRPRRRPRQGRNGRGGRRPAQRQFGVVPTASAWRWRGLAREVGRKHPPARAGAGHARHAHAARCCMRPPCAAGRPGGNCPL